MAASNPAVPRMVQDFYRTLRVMDREAEIARTNVKLACLGPGCCGCCHQIVLVQTLEALGLALMALARPDWDQHAQQLAMASRPFLNLRLTPTDHFQTRTLCCYGTTGSCEVYQARPIMCRYFYVLGDDHTACWPPDVAPVTPLDLRDTINKARRWAKGAAIDLRLPDIMAPLAPMVLWAMESLGTDEQQEVLVGLVQNRPDPVEWHQLASARAPG